MVYSGRFQFGYKHWPYCRNFTWLLRIRMLRILLRIMYCFWVSTGYSTYCTGNLVMLLRIYNWQTLQYTSFIAGIVQTFFYADFIYYFMKSNQNERIINLPIWVCLSGQKRLNQNRRGMISWCIIDARCSLYFNLL